MKNDFNWFPIDLRIFPIDFSLPLPKSAMVRVALYLEMTLALLSVFGALLLTVIPPATKISSNQGQVTTPKSAPATPAECPR